MFTTRPGQSAMSRSGQGLTANRDVELSALLAQISNAATARSCITERVVNDLTTRWVRFDGDRHGVFRLSKRNHVIEPKDAGLFRRRQYWISDQVFPGNFRLDPAQIVEGFNRAPQRPTEVNRRLVEAVIGDTIDAKAIEGGTRHPHRSNPHWQCITTMGSLMIFAHPWPSP